MKTIALIPARYEATRFPGKLMQMLGNKTVIRHVYDNMVESLLFDEVMVVTDHHTIFDEIIGNGGYATMSRKKYESGTDRIAEAVENIDANIIVNVQGDEPFVNRKILESLLHLFIEKDNPVSVASLMHPIDNNSDIQDPNQVKVVVDNNNNALFFSRSVIPYHRDKLLTPLYYKHIGIYAFQRDALLQFASLPQGNLEKIEKLEQLRYLENGISIKMALTHESPLSIDTPEDFVRAQNFLPLL